METYVIIIINKFFYVEILLEKATYSGHIRHHKFFYVEILLEKATYSGHMDHHHHHDEGCEARGVVVFCMESSSVGLLRG